MNNFLHHVALASQLFVLVLAGYVLMQWMAWRSRRSRWAAFFPTMCCWA